MQEEKRGKFIVLEGIDGCGKSSQIYGVIKYFLEKDKHNHVIVTREPYKNREIRKILGQDSDAYSKAGEIAQLYMQDRQEHVDNVIKPALEMGHIVVSDRYKYSTIVYQSVQGLLIQELIEKHKHMPIPDLILIFDINVDEASKRMLKDKRNEHKFESDKEFQDKLRKKYLEMPQIFPEEKIIIINAMKTIQEIEEEVKNILIEHFN